MKISIFLNHPECSAQCCVGMYEALHPHHAVDFFTKEQFKSKTFKDIDMVAFPGGIGDSDTFHTLVKPNEGYVLDFLDRGGKYLGICMGAYWAGHHYFDILKGIQAKQYIKQPGADVKRSFGTVSNITWQGQPEQMYFYDGCSLVGNIDNSRVIARYPNGDAMALIQGNVGVIGCHPESMYSWYDKKFLKPHWHQGRHHNLLLDFVNLLT